MKNENNSNEDLIVSIIKLFINDGKYIGYSNIDGGSINSTYIVTYYSYIMKRNKKFILQKINEYVFHSPFDIIQNFSKITEHMAVSKSNLNSKVISNIKTLSFPKDNNIRRFLRYKDTYWRTLEYFEGSVTLKTISQATQAYSIGEVLASFHLLTQDIPLKDIKTVIPFFHDINYYQQSLDEAIKIANKSAPSKLEEVENYISIVNGYKSFIQKCHHSIRFLGLRKRLIHNDPKLENFLFNENLLTSISLIDLDTCSSGLLAYDLADCLRSICNKNGENSDNFLSISFDVDILYSFLSGYQSITYIDTKQLNFLLSSLKLLTLELAIRFLTDHLLGNKYFKVNYPNQNKHRAMVQFNLLSSINDQEMKISQVISNNWSLN